MAAARPGRRPAEGQIADGIDALQAATRVLTGVALRSLDALGDAVSLPQYRVLAVLGDLGRVRSARVADALGLEASTITRLADRLVASGHVARGSDPSNRSAVTLELTPAGQHLVSELTRWRHRELRRILLRLRPADRAALTQALRLLVESAGEGYGTVPRAPVPV